MHVELDPQAARPLTSREISKVLCGIIGVVTTQEPRTKTAMPAILDMLKYGWNNEFEAFDILGSPPGMTPVTLTWASALAATVLGLRGWCNPRDVNTAIAWITHNLDRIYQHGSNAPLN